MSAAAPVPAAPSVWAAAAIASLGIVLLTDGLTPWLRQFAGGLAEPLMVALVLAAVERGLAGRERAALALTAAAALVRPEIWPALLAYGVWLWRERPARRGEVAIAVAVVALLWFVPDLLGSGSFLTGADRAREGSGSPPIEALEVLGRAAVLPLAVFWVGFGVGALAARDREDHALAVVAAGVLGWIALVAVMAAGGYAGLPRFLAPAAAVAVAIGAAGLARVAASAWASRRSPALVAARGVGARFPGPGRLANRRAGRRRRQRHQISSAGADLELIVAEAGKAPIRECGEVVVGAIEGQTAAAWLLELPIDDVDVSKTPPAHGVYLRAHRRGLDRPRLGLPGDRASATASDHPELGSPKMLLQ